MKKPVMENFIFWAVNRWTVYADSCNKGLSLVLHK